MMPLIEVLPLNTSHRTQPGWAYVADTAGQPSTSSGAPLAQNRKRAARFNASGPDAARTSAKQQKAIEARLKDLDKENYRDVALPIPKRGEGRDAPKQQKKQTSNVRRIMGYSRGFAHYLADEEAALAAGGGGFVGTWGVVNTTIGKDKDESVNKEKEKEKRRSLGGTAAGRGRGRKRATETEEVKSEPQDQQDVQMTGADEAAADKPSSSTSTTDPTAAGPQTQPQSPPKPRYDPALDKEPLLKTVGLPPKPSARVMAALLAEPPLSYAAARATPLEPEKQTPRRHFCAVCGYWGKVRCRKCGERTCGLLECWKGHEVAGCVPY